MSLRIALFNNAFEGKEIIVPVWARRDSNPQDLAANSF